MATSLLKRIIASAKALAGGAPDLTEEGNPAFRLGWEVQDIIGVEEPPEVEAVFAAAAISPVRPKLSLAAKRLSSLHTRKQAMDAAFAAEAAVAGGANWVPIGPTAIPNGQALDATFRVLVSGRITDIAIDPSAPSTIYIATARGGVWKTIDGGAGWTPLTDNELSLANGAIAIAPDDPQTIYAGTGEGNLEFYVRNLPLNSSPDNYLGAGVLKSTDGGTSWRTQGIPALAGAGFFRIAVHPATADFAFAATTKGLYRTSDGGTTWVQMTNGLPPLSDDVIGACDVAIHPTDPNVAFAAFFGDGIYRTSDALAADPTWTKITAGVPSEARRIAIAIAPSLPDRVYALFTSGEAFGGLAMSVPGTAGATWTTTPLSANIGQQCSYNLDLNVDPTTPDILYISALSLYKVTNTAGTWSATDIGRRLHSDQHCLAFDPSNHLVLYAGTDGGIYSSADGGATWSDSMNRGMTITQFEFIDQHPSSDAVLFGGTQDNGTQAYRNSEIFYHADEGDGSYVAIDPVTPANILHGFFSGGMGRSTAGGDFGKWDWTIGSKVGMRSLFYPPFALDGTPNPKSIAFGGKGVALDDAQGTGGWKTQIILPNLGPDMVSALEYVSSTLIYAGTTMGKVYMLTKNAGVWTPLLISAAPLPARWIWDIVVEPDDPHTIHVALSGFGTPHVFRGVVAGTTAVWTPAGGADAGALPDAPIYAIALRPGPPKTYYAGTDVGVYSSSDPAVSWELFNSGLPNTAVYDLQYHDPSNFLRAGTHGRGLWERRLDPTPSPSDADVYLRASIMSSGRMPAEAGAPAAFNDPLRHVSIGTPVSWWQSADIKIDALQTPAGGGAPQYQMTVAEVNDLTFETTLRHHNPLRGRVNRIYVQVHNRGIRQAGVTVKLLHANSFGGVLLPLPADFWTAFPGDGDITNWKPIGAAQNASVPPGRSAILEWDWTPAPTDVENASLLAVCDSADDPIPEAGKAFDAALLAATEKRATQLTLRVIDALASMPAAVDWTPLSFFADGKSPQFDLKVQAINAKAFSIVVPEQQGIDVSKATGVKVGKMTAAISADMVKALGDVAKNIKASVLTLSSPGTSAVLPISPGASPIQIFAGIGRPASGRANVSFVQEANQVVRGGCTIIVEAK